MSGNGDDVEYQLLSSSSWESGIQLRLLDSSLLISSYNDSLQACSYQSSNRLEEQGISLKHEECATDSIEYTQIYEFGMKYDGDGNQMPCNPGSSSSVPYSQEKCHRCIFCHNDFDTSESLTLHMSVHTSGKRGSQFLAHTPRRLSDAELSSKQKNSRIDDSDTPSGSSVSISRGNRYRCVFCHNDFSTREALTFHMKEHTTSTSEHSSTKLHKCERCGEEFNHSNQLAGHMKKHGGTMMTKFRNKFQSASSLVHQVKTNDREKYHRCVHCTMVFDTIAALLGHMQTHNHKCEKCDCQFERESDLAAHMQSHMVKNQYRCIFCHNDFPTSESLTVHMKCHTNEKKYRCTYPNCQEAFQTNSDLLNHKKNHINDNAYKCEICLKTFQRSSHLFVHIRTHTVNTNL